MKGDYARARVTGPAVGLMIVCLISLTLLCLALLFDVWFLLSGRAAEAGARRGTSEETAVAVRMIWSILLVATNAAILAGAFQMKGLRSRALSRIACILALIPCLGPCIVLGIPFGIWGLVVLNEPHVRGAFES